MSELTVYDMQGESVGSFEVSGGWLVTDKGDQAVHDVVVAHLARRRAGTASTLSKSEVAGSNRKPWRQKGTGRARAGYRQSPVWRGGAVAFGPRPRTYGGKINRKVARLALRRVLSDKIAEGCVRIIEELALSEARTRKFAEVLTALNISGPVLFVLDKVSREVALAGRNIPGVELVAACNLNAYQVLRYPSIVISRAGMAELEQRLKGREKEA
jgi:large subunit ribosomal protein L4